jgi:hypothetical protein
MKRRRKRVKEAYQNLFSKLSDGERDSLVGALRALNDILSKGTE